MTVGMARDEPESVPEPNQDQDQVGDQDQDQAMKITGTLVFEDLEGGFWGILGTDGGRYEIENKIPNGIAKPGAKVTAEVEPTGGFSIRQWGTPVKIVRIKTVN